MKTYREMKKTLKNAGKNTSYFTKEFYDIFIKEYRQAIQNVINKTDIKTYMETKKSDFYNKNGTCYCIFLEEFYDEKMKI